MDDGSRNGVSAEALNAPSRGVLCGLLLVEKIDQNPGAVVGRIERFVHRAED